MNRFLIIKNAKWCPRLRPRGVSEARIFLTYRNLVEGDWFRVLDPGCCRLRSQLETCLTQEPRMVHQQELDLMTAHVTFWHACYVEENPQAKRKISTYHNPFDWADNFSQLSNKLSEESFGTETLFIPCIYRTTKLAARQTNYVSNRLAVHLILCMLPVIKRRVPLAVHWLKRIKTVTEPSESRPWYTQNDSDTQIFDSKVFKSKIF